ncbi:glycerophosphodiester phosphodiesterase family protein [Jiella marina]|uniref:glycerophosphodiester phosphodiesterase family protein n=1 Tax=Jiella sp. LLJ827 TaxID=2917712 RepID=UPI0021013E4C|nr:glycerophosphodiester phosphodiesterase family protein [Jiella sp. LLJ827]MCQ0986877.1 glycerophosphodiester phosphodiesterase [Jiella sp. LLJ827]
MRAYDGPFRWLVERPIAHRGLHDGNRTIPENSISAALAAIAAGYAIECDVQMSADGTPHVFHDANVNRMTGRHAAFAGLDDRAIAELRLGPTTATIPTLSHFLSIVHGQVPVVVELKGGDRAGDPGYFSRIKPLIDAYRGHLALMSFDHWVIDQMLEDRPVGRPIGLTADGSRAGVLATHRAVFERGCDFVSYDVHDLPNSFVDWVRRERSAPALSWTVRNESELVVSARHVDQITFEDFAPQH